MKLAVAPSDPDTATLPARLVGKARPHPTTQTPAWGWAVVEIKADGTWGRTRVVRAPGPIEATAVATGATAPAGLRELTPTIQSDLGALHVSNGDLHQAVVALTRGTTSSDGSPARDECLGRLAHVEAMLGELRRADRHAARVRNPVTGTVNTGVHHAQMARAWIALERAEFEKARRRLDVVSASLHGDQDPWLAASRLLVEAKLLIAAGQPDAATRLLATARGLDSLGEHGEWLSDLMTVTRAEALLAAGEPQRVLAILTPMPASAAVDATVVAAAARQGIGDTRGAQAVLSSAVAELESAPLALQIEGWLLESRLAEDRGKHDRARQVLDRALRAATAQQMRRPLMRDWRWLRAFVDREPMLMHYHRDFLATCQVDVAPLPRQRLVEAGSEPPLGAPLTERERQVLDLLAQMCSTDEIAAALYVSSNTVKTHLKGIFGKLCVNRRVEAVRRGRQLGLC